jgi:YD repeat-containing protein
MNEKYQRYIEFIANDLQPPYFENMKDSYGLKDSEYSLVLSKLFNDPVEILGTAVYSIKDRKLLYNEDNDGYWSIKKYDKQNNLISNETSTGHWEKYGYDKEGNMTYRENRSGYIRNYR